MSPNENDTVGNGTEYIMDPNLILKEMAIRDAFSVLPEEYYRRVLAELRKMFPGQYAAVLSEPLPAAVKEAAHPRFPPALTDKGRLQRSFIKSSKTTPITRVRHGYTASSREKTTRVVFIPAIKIIEAAEREILNTVQGLPGSSVRAALREQRLAHPREFAAVGRRKPKERQLTSGQGGPN